jgi:serine protease Do
MSEPGVVEAAARVCASVVQVRSGAGPAAGGGAGIAWRGDELIVTNAHVAMTPRLSVVLPEGRAVPGEVIRRDAHRDLALVRAPGASLPRVSTADPRTLRPGTLVFAVGHPLGVTDAVSAGVLQATGPLPPGLGLPGDKRRLSWVQADLRLAPGNSGGPLADAAGRVVGVAAMIVAGLALAVPAPDVEAFVAAGASGFPARLGVVARPVALGDPDRIGLALAIVERGAPADRAGLAAGDVLVAVDGEPLHTPADLERSVHGARGGWMTVDVVRGARWRRHQVALGATTT